MEISDKDRKVLIAICGVMVIGIIAIVVIMINYRSDGMSCLSNPMVYGAVIQAEDIDGSVSCVCTMTNKEGKTGSFSFSDQGYFNPPDEQLINFNNLGDK